MGLRTNVSFYVSLVMKVRPPTLSFNRPHDEEIQGPPAIC